MGTRANLVREVRKSQEKPFPDVELFREFMVRRSWLAGNGEHDLITGDQYDSLKRRDGKFWRSLTQRQRDYLLGYIDGWNRSVKPLDTLSPSC